MVTKDLGRERRRPPRSGPPLLLPLPDQHARVRGRLTLARAGCLLQQPDEVQAIALRLLRKAVPLVGRQPQPAPAVLPAEEQRRLHRRSTAGLANRRHLLRAQRADRPVEPSQSSLVLTPLRQQLGHQLDRARIRRAVLQRPQMLPRLGISTLLETQLRQAVPGEAGILAPDRDQLTPHRDGTVRFACLLPRLAGLQKDLATLLRIPDRILLKLS